MSELTNLSADVLENFISTLDEDSLKALRLTCRRLSGFSNLLLFRSIALYNTPSSCRLLQSILAQLHLRDEIHHLDLNTVKEDDDTDDEDEVDPPSGWEEILEQIPTLSNLHSVALRFDKKCAADGELVHVYAPQTETYRQTLFRWLFAALTDLRPPLKELAIQNHQNVIPISRSVSSWMDEVLGTMESLKLNLVRECDFAAPEDEIESLTLGNFSFVNDEQLNWILQHSSTLGELYMDHCFIVFYVSIPGHGNVIEKHPLAESDVESSVSSSPGLADRLIRHYPRRWHDYLTSLHNGLPGLSQFGFGTSQSWEQEKMPFEKEWNLVDELTQDRYCPFDDGFCCYPNSEWPDCYQADLHALKALQQGIGQKANLK